MSVPNTEIIQRLQQLDELRFERFIAELWERRGWNTSVTKASNDEGIDVVATRDRPYSEKELIQAKRYRQGNRVGGPEIQQYGSLHHHGPDVDKVVVVTTSDFTDSALTQADRSNVKPINGTALAQMIRDADALELVKKYTDEVDGDLESPMPEPTNASEEDLRLEDNKKPLTLLDDSSFLTAELLGLERASMTISGNSSLRGNEQFDGFLVAFNLFNRSDRDVVIEEIDAFELTDKGGTTYSAANLGGGVFGGNWVKHGGGHTVDDGWINAGSAKKYVVGFNTPERVKPSKITLTRYGIEFDLDHEIRQKISGLPDTLSNF